MTNDIIESAGMEPVVSQSDLELALKVAERNEELCRKIKILAIKQTNISDWVDMDDKHRFVRASKTVGHKAHICARQEQKSYGLW